MEIIKDYGILLLLIILSLYCIAVNDIFYAEYYWLSDSWTDFSTSCSVYGCTDPIACNYDVNATDDDGSCLTAYGCTNPLACNYDPIASCDDGSCLTAYGCMDASACNYDASATCDDGSCLTAYGCMDCFSM